MAPIPPSSAPRRLSHQSPLPPTLRPGAATAVAASRCASRGRRSYLQIPPRRGRQTPGRARPFALPARPTERLLPLPFPSPFPHRDRVLSPARRGSPHPTTPHFSTESGPLHCKVCRSLHLGPRIFPSAKRGADSARKSPAKASEPEDLPFGQCWREQVALRCTAKLARAGRRNCEARCENIPPPPPTPASCGEAKLEALEVICPGRRHNMI